MAMTLDDAAVQVAEKLAGGGPPNIDPAFLLFLKEMLEEFLPLLLEMCNETVDTVPNACRDMMKGGGEPVRRLVGRWKVKRSAGRRLLRKYSLTAGDLLDGMLEVGAAASPSEVESIYNQC